MAVARVISAVRILRDAARFDVVFMNRDIVPDPGIRFLEPWLARRNPRMIFDFDDSIHLGSREAKLRAVLPLFSWITPGNSYLAEFARLVNPNVSIWPTVVDTDAFVPARDRAPGPVRIGWSGSDSTARECLPLLRESLCSLAATEDLEFVVISGSRPDLDWPGVKIRYLPWTAETEVAELQQIDVGLMPLRDAPFERGKCGLKAIQYMACGIPALVSPVGVNAEIVDDGVEGFHCVTDEDWVRRLRQLLKDGGLRRRMGEAGRERAVGRYSVSSLLPSMVATFAAVASMGRR